MRHFERDLAAQATAHESCAPKRERIDDRADGTRMVGQ
jgi:hypothetical protein